MDNDVKFGEWIEKGFNLYKNNFAILVPATLIAVILSAAEPQSNVHLVFIETYRERLLVRECDCPSRASCVDRPARRPAMQPREARRSASRSPSRIPVRTPDTKHTACCVFPS